MLSICTWEANDKEKNISTVRWIMLLIEDKNQFLANMHRLQPKRTEYPVFETLTLRQSFVIWNECTYQKNVQGCPVVPWLWLGIWNFIGPQNKATSDLWNGNLSWSPQGSHTAVCSVYTHCNLWVQKRAWAPLLMQPPREGRGSYVPSTLPDKCHQLQMLLTRGRSEKQLAQMRHR